MNKTARGFNVSDFNDAKGQECSMQDSSAMHRHGLIWFGRDDANPRLPNGESVPIPDFVRNKNMVLFNDRMHLNKRQVSALVRNFEKFLLTKKVRKRNFKDRNFQECSIRKTDNMIELGCDDANPQYCDQGWRPLKYPENTIFNIHMFLDTEQIVKLLPFMKHFVEYGTIG